eukprot:5251574-Amphidinium_carterae.1
MADAGIRWVLDKTHKYKTLFHVVASPLPHCPQFTITAEAEQTEAPNATNHNQTSQIAICSGV